ncbi:hypothetical protein NEMBOFW57_003106 [Staphylotrichum longicolle]|uniref:FAD-binding domain-containing protein n=1 Tax=Staphylotrichum longicolle TaxID=669026 RepID=A0AAD4F5K0_9PEZI|nr:hypothetical protein NEMBOFW57_003106 [Staphylotrichum longicolle]
MDGKTLKDIDLTEANARWPHPWHLVHRASLHKELKRVATSEERPGTPVKLFPHHRVVKVNDERGATLDNGTVMEADVILGADGIFSTARKAIKRAFPFPTGKAAFRFVLPRSLAEADPITAPLVSQKGTLTIWFAKDRRVVMYPCDNNERLNFVCIHPDTESQEPRPPFEMFKDASPDNVSEKDPEDSENSHARIKWSPEWNKDASLTSVLRVFKGFDPALTALFSKADPASIKVWQLMDMETLFTWVSSKLALLGDAAHPCLPYQAQGGAQAIEDAAALAAVLPLGTDPEVVPERLKLYELIRCARAHRIQEYSRLTGQDWVGGKPVVDMRAFEKYNFDHDEIANATAAFKKYLATKQGKV